MEDAEGSPLDSSCLMETRRPIGKAGMARAEGKPQGTRAGQLDEGALDLES